MEEESTGVQSVGGSGETTIRAEGSGEQSVRVGSWGQGGSGESTCGEEGSTGVQPPFGTYACTCPMESVSSCRVVANSAVLD